MRKSWKSYLKRALLLSIGLVIPFASITVFPFARLAFPGVKHDSDRRETAARTAPFEADRIITREEATGSSGIIRDTGRSTGEFAKLDFSWSTGTGKYALLPLSEFFDLGLKGNFMVGRRVREPCFITGNGACVWNGVQLRGS